MEDASTLPDKECIQSVRRFTRFYTARLGTLEEGLLDSPLSLAEARLLYEIATLDQPAASTIAARLRLDPGYLSRLVARLQQRGLIRRRRYDSDARQSLIFLTAAGRREFNQLDRRSNEQVAAMIAPLRADQRRNLMQAMGSIESLLDPTPAQSRDPFVLRGHRPGDMGTVIHRHSVLYAQEYGWDERFEALVARVAAAFIDHYDPACEHCWIAERDGEFLGCVFLVKERAAEHTARLRLLLVEPSARGLGLGRALVRQCTHFARQAGYHRIVLWTNSVLDAARHIYESEGYRLTHEEPHESFGKKLISQDWELLLHSA